MANENLQDDLTVVETLAANAKRMTVVDWIMAVSWFLLGAAPGYELHHNPIEAIGLGMGVLAAHISGLFTTSPVNRGGAAKDPLKAQL